MTHGHLKTVTIANEMVFLGAIVIPEYLLIQVAEQVERLDVDVRSLESAFEQTPEVFEAVGMNLPINVAFSMVNRLVSEGLVIQPLIGQKCVGVDRTVCFDVSANLRLQVVLPASGNDVGPDLAATFQNSHNSGFALDATVSNFLAALVSVHESSRAADEGFVYLDFFAAPAELYELLVVQCEPDAVHHKPSGLLSDAERARHFIGTDSILGVHDEPNGNHPLVHTERGVLEDRTNLDRKLLLTFLAEPDAPRRNEGVLRRIAAWTSDLAIRPAQPYRIVERALRVREESDCFLQRLGKLECVCHV